MGKASKKSLDGLLNPFVTGLDAKGFFLGAGGALDVVVHGSDLGAEDGVEQGHEHAVVVHDGDGFVRRQALVFHLVVGGGTAGAVGAGLAAEEDADIIGARPFDLALEEL